MIIGITSAIACGKSKVLKYLASIGYDVYSLDDISHNVFDMEDINKQIRETFNIKQDSNVKREEISKLIFSSDNYNEKLELLNNILHPLILNKMNDLISEAKINNKNIFIEVPLLYENNSSLIINMRSSFDKVLFIYASKENQIKRLMKRNNIDKKEAERRIDALMNVEEKKKIALNNFDIIIDNNGDVEYTYKQIDKFINDMEK